MDTRGETVGNASIMPHEKLRGDRNSLIESVPSAFIEMQRKRKFGHTVDMGSCHVKRYTSCTGSLVNVHPD